MVGGRTSAPELILFQYKNLINISKYEPQILINSLHHRWPWKPVHSPDQPGTLHQPCPSEGSWVLGVLWWRTVGNPQPGTFPGHSCFPLGGLLSGVPRVRVTADSPASQCLEAGEGHSGAGEGGCHFSTPKPP